MPASRSRKLGLIAGLSLGAVSATASADMIYNESIDGDLSGNGLAPTSLLFGAGSNQVLGTTGDPGTGIDRDYFTFFVPEGMTLSGITLLPNTFVSGSSSFMGMQAGPQLTVTPTGGGAQDLIGILHYENSMIGTDILPTMGITGGLGSGAYSVWVQELGGVVDYGFDFHVAPVPVPGAALLLVSGLAGLAAMRRRRATV